MEQLLVILLIKLAAASSIASLLSRSSRFLNLLLKEERSMVERLELSAAISSFCALGSLVRLATRTYTAADITLEGSMVCGLVGGYVSGLVGGVICSLPATVAGEYMAMPLCAAVGVLGGLVRDLSPHATRSGGSRRSSISASIAWSAIRKTGLAAPTTSPCSARSCWPKPCAL